MMRSPAVLEHEPPMLLGFSWSEITTIFFPSSGVWLLLSILLSIGFGASVQEVIMTGTVVYLVGESITMTVLAYCYGKVRRNKYDGWHLHWIATQFHGLGIFKNIYYGGKWRC